MDSDEADIKANDSNRSGSERTRGSREARGIGSKRKLNRRANASGIRIGAKQLSEANGPRSSKPNPLDKIVQRSKPSGNSAFQIGGRLGHAKPERPVDDGTTYRDRVLAGAGMRQAGTAGERPKDTTDETEGRQNDPQDARSLPAIFGDRCKHHFVGLTKPTGSKGSRLWRSTSRRKKTTFRDLKTV
jgi:hypothetical protein